MNLTRREFSVLIAGAAAAASKPAKPNSKFAGVQIGVQTYSYRSMPLDKAVEGMVAAGINSCELWAGHVEPRNYTPQDLAAEGLRLGAMTSSGVPAADREEVRRFRLDTSLTHWGRIREMFDRAGVEIYAYNYGFRDDCSDTELERGFAMAKTLGAKCITASGTVSVARRVDPLAQKHKMRVGWHNHSNKVPNEYARPEDFAEAKRGKSSYMAINLDIGHFTAAGYNPVDFISQHAADILTLHVKDRKKNQGDNVPFGTGDTPIRQVLQLLRDKKYPIVANIEYEYEGGDAVDAVKKCVAYCKAALVG